MSLSKEWTDKRTGDGKKDFEKYILNSGQLLDRLTEMIEKRISEVDVKQERDDFTSPSWAMQQAFLMGKRSALNEIRRLLDRG